MSITLYSKFRRQNLRRAWDFAGMTEWCVNVGLSIILFLAAIILVQYVADKAIAADDAEHKAKSESRKVAKLEETWLSCLNNKGLWINDRLHICSVADTHIRQGE
jgi:hypothetical protein